MKEHETVISNVTGDKPVTNKRINIDDLIENDWNPNVMPQDLYAKLRRSITKLWKKTKVLPVPVTVRPHPTLPGKYQVIDGKHRRKVFIDNRDAGKKGYDKIPCVIIDVDTKTAMLLTQSLNRLRGEDDPDKQAELFHRLNSEQEMSPEEIAEYLPESEEEIAGTLQNYDLEVEHLTFDDDTNGEDKQSKPKSNDDHLEIKCFASRGATEVIEAEVSRLATILGGKNARGRAFEMMAVLSSQTPLESIQNLIPTTDEDQPKKARKKASVKKRLEAKAQEKGKAA